MDSTIETFPNTTRSVFSSLENRTDILSSNANMNKLQNIQPNIKRYSISQDIKDKFYAIHHNESDTKKLSSTRGRKRIAPDAPLIKPADQLISAPTLTDSSKRNKRNRQQNACLYQTCQQLWPEDKPSKNEWNHDHIKSLSDLLKVRLNQAKFKMMATLDKDNELFTYLAQEYAPPNLTSSHASHISSSQQKSKSTMAVVGNGKNLFNRHKYQKQVSPIYSDLPTSPIHAASTSLQKHAKDQKKPQKSCPNKPKRITAPKRKSVAADVIPVVLSDGSSVFVCEPCNKKYKNRNGLAYHMERCKYRLKSTDNNAANKETSTQPEYNSSINCICSQTTEDGMTMLQCEKCRNWSHSECVGISDAMLEEAFYCTKCKESIEEENTADNSDLSEADQIGNDLLKCLIEAQIRDTTSQPFANRTDLPYLSEQQQQDQLNQLQELLSQPILNNQEENDPLKEDDEVSSMPTSHTSEDDKDKHKDTLEDITDSSQWNIWEDFTTFNDKSSQEQWALTEEEEPFSNYDTDVHSSTWNTSELNIFNQPPSLLFSENTLNSTLDDDAAPLISDIATPIQLPEAPQDCESISKVNTPLASNSNTPYASDGWFQFANFDNDYECEN